MFPQIFRDRSVIADGKEFQEPQYPEDDESIDNDDHRRNRQALSSSSASSSFWERAQEANPFKLETFSQSSPAAVHLTTLTSRAGKHAPLPAEVGLSSGGLREDPPTAPSGRNFTDSMLEGHNQSQAAGCLMNMVASTWVYLFHSIFRHKLTVDKENEDIRMSIVQQDLVSCSEKLNARERQLSKRIEVLTKEAVARKKVGDIVGAKKRLVDRKRLSVQLERLISSISIIDMHINTIEGTELNKSILQTLKASADAMKKMGINSSGVEGVENIVQEVETQMEYASEITKIISAANVTGTINTMGHDVFTDEELEKELEELLGGDDDDIEQQQHQGPAGLQHMLEKMPSVPRRTAKEDPSKPASAVGERRTLDDPPPRTMAPVESGGQSVASPEAPEGSSSKQQEMKEPPPVSQSSSARARNSASAFYGL